MIYVSYFGNKDVGCVSNDKKVCIALRNPSLNIESCELGLIPSAELVYGYKYGGLTEEDYVQKYFTNNLNNINPQDILATYDGKILLCYCKCFCHRNIIEYWLNSNGIACKEFESEDLKHFNQPVVGGVANE